MKVLLIGSGGREHALAWKLTQSPRTDTLWATPGNPGIEKEQARLNAGRRRVEIGEHGISFDTDLTDHESVVSFCRTYEIDLVVIGPEAPLVAGLADDLRVAGFPVFGPSAAAARLEGSKGFTKDLCARAGIPTARYARVSDLASAKAALADFPLPVVIKADGIAAGKGVVVAETAGQAELAINDMFGGAFGEAGASVVIEEFLTGEEASFFALTDGTAVVPFGSAQDHKRVGDGDTGPNTGGMGAYSPASILTPKLERRVLDEIVCPTVRAMAEAGTPYSGVLYAGLMLTADGPKLIEYNARFGDPECQVLMMRLENDLLDLLLATAEGRLAEADPPRFRAAAALTVVLAAEGYPGAPKKGGAIGGIEPAEASGAKVFHAGTALRDGKLVAAGGRVLNVTASGATVAETRERAYQAVAAIDFADGFHRSDIGWREIARKGPSE